MHRRPLAVSLALMAVTIVAGVTVRFIHLGLPAGVVKYGGSGLWAAMIYWLCSTVMPGVTCLPSGVVTTSIETAIPGTSAD